MRTEEIQQIVQEYDYLRDELNKAQSNLFHFTMKTAEVLISNNMAEFLKVDWTKLSRIKRSR